MCTILSSSDIGAAVRRARKAAGLRQDDVAGLAEVGTRFLVELEAGKPTLRLDKVLAVLAVLGMAMRIAGGPARPTACSSCGGKMRSPGD